MGCGFDSKQPIFRVQFVDGFEPEVRGVGQSADRQQVGVVVSQPGNLIKTSYVKIIIWGIKLVIVVIILRRNCLTNFLFFLIVYFKANVILTFEVF